MWDQMARKVETLQEKVVSFLGKDIIQEESVGTVHKPEMIYESMQRSKRAQQALYRPKLPLNKKTNDSQLFNSTTVKVNYIISAMKKFLKALSQKEPDLVP
jgi:hypothetical protein